MLITHLNVLLDRTQELLLPLSVALLFVLFHGELLFLLLFLLLSKGSKRGLLLDQRAVQVSYLILELLVGVLLSFV